MKFEKFYDNLKKETLKVFKINTRTIEVQQTIVEAYMVHETIKANKKLIWATWIMVIATIILSIITLVTGV